MEIGTIPYPEIRLKNGNMLITDKIIDQGMSINGGWNLKQMNALGMKEWVHGWRKRVVGLDWPDERIQLFLSLKDAHVKHGKKIKNELIFEPIVTTLNFPDQYKHPNWQKFRLEVLRKDNFKCVGCHNTSKTLHVHHLKYIKGKYIWEVPIWYTVTLCEDCHSKEHNRDLRIK